MNYDNESTKNFEEKFQEFVKNLRNFSDEDRAKWIEQLKTILVGLQQLVDKEDKTPEEEQALKEMTPKFLELHQQLSDFHLLLGEKVFRDAKVIHEEIKKKAAAGDPQAIKSAKELDEEYRKLLDKEISKN